MAQVMVNFRMDEDVKKSMEQACREMGLSMTTAFTIFATKVGKEKRIPFEVTAAEPRRRSPAAGEDQSGREGEPPAPARRLEELCGEIRRSLTAIHTAIPASATGLTMERIRLLCGDRLKDQAAEAARAGRALFPGGSAQPLRGRDPDLLAQYLGGLSSIGAQLREVERTLVPAMRACSGGDAGRFQPYEERLAEVSRQFDQLAPVLSRFLSSTARSGAEAVQARVRQAAGAVETPYVRTALEGLEALLLRYYDALEERARVRLEADYLQTLELTLGELGRAEREAGGDVGEKAALCLRAISVLVQMVSDGGRARQEWDRRGLEAEVEALERLAAMRGDVAGDITPTG